MKLLRDISGLNLFDILSIMMACLVKKTKFEELKLNKNQIDALIYLDNIQKECRQLWITQSETKDGSKIEFMSKKSQNSYTKQGGVFEIKDCFEMRIKQIEPLTFNNLRRSCGGHFPQIEKEDLVFEFLSDLMIKSYPYLLIRHTKKPIRPLFLSSISNFHFLFKTRYFK